MKNDPSSLRYPATVLVALFLTLLFPAATAQATTIFGLTDANRLIVFDSSAPENVAGTVVITGLQSGETLLGIDFRPTTGQLYGVGSTSRLYRINAATGTATQVGAGSFAPALNLSAESGMEVGFSFETAQGWIRIVANGQSLRLDPDSGTVVAIDAPVFNTLSIPGSQFPGRTPRLVGLAYRDSTSQTGNPHGTLYAIDAMTSTLVRIGSVGAQPVSPNAGEVFPVGSLFSAQCSPGPCVAITDTAGFDITPHGLAFASLTIKDTPSSALFHVDLSNGQATPFGAIGTGGTFLRGIAIAPEGTNLHAVTQTNQLLLFNANMPHAILKSTLLTGLQPGETIVGLETREWDEQLYALESTGRLYRINLATGATEFVHLITLALDDRLFGIAGFLDGMRIVSSTAKSWQLSFGFELPGRVSSAASKPLAYAADDPNAGRVPQVVALTHTTGAADAGELAFASVFYGIDRSNNSLVYERGNDLGTLHTVGPLGVVGIEFHHLDIGLAPYAVITPPYFKTFQNARTTLHTIDLKTGHATPIGFVGNGDRLYAMAVAPTRTVQFVASDLSVEENCTSVALTVIRDGDPSLETGVDFTTTSSNVGTSQTPADERRDYNATLGTLRFFRGETSKRIRVLVNEDSYAETAGEVFKVVLSNPTGRLTLDSPAEATVLITDDGDDPAFNENPIDENYNFVCQQYHDFLNRDPDTGGLDFWASQINACANDAACIERKRADVSGAFFLSIEFQETGFFVYRAYQAAYGRAPVPITFAEFLRDVQQVAEGVVIGQTGALDRLRFNKDFFLREFVNRREFVERYPPNITPEAFVDALDLNSGGVLSPSERAHHIDETRFAGRNYSLLSVIDDADFKRLAFNRAFVLSQYFGYLRRNPNAAPDEDFSGFNFWLAKLDQHNGDFRAAEMVKAFINAGEYRRRFGAQ